MEKVSQSFLEGFNEVLERNGLDRVKSAQWFEGMGGFFGMLPSWGEEGKTVDEATDISEEDQSKWEDMMESTEGDTTA